jgi:hypothetical protein
VAAAVLVGPLIAVAPADAATYFYAPGCTGTLDVGSTSTTSAYTDASVYCTNFVSYRRMIVRSIVNNRQVWKTDPLISGNAQIGSRASIYNRTSYLPYQATYQSCARISTSTQPEVCTPPASWK